MNNKQLMDEMRYYLHQHGYKLTPQRETILNVLANEDEHLSAEDIYDRVRKDNPNIGLATVYRTLEMLSAMKIIDKVSFEDQKVRYEWRKTELTHAHHHLYCKDCGTIIEIDEDLIGLITPIISKKYHFQIDDLPLSFYGYCEDCQKKRSES